MIGYEIDDRVAAQVSRIAASQVAFYYDDAVVKTTLSPMQEAELGRQRNVMRLRSVRGGSRFNWERNDFSSLLWILRVARIHRCV